MIYGIVYMYKNQIDGKVYIGQTTQPMCMRRRDHRQLAFNSKKLRNDHFHLALRKYGKEAFEETVLCASLDKESLDKAEQYFINVFDSVDKSKGYNLKTGGSHGKHTEETKRKISEASKKLWQNPEHRTLISEAGKRNYKYINNPESRKKSGATRKGKPATLSQIKNLSVKWGKR